MDDPQRPSRRDFLRRSTAIGAAAAAQVGVLRSAHAFGSETFRIGIIGSGNRGTGAAADNLRVAPHVKLVAIGDAFDTRAQLSRKMLKQYFPGQVDVPDERLFVGLDAYRKVLACDVDLVIHGAPPGFRPMHYRAAIMAGKHIFMEKPCCVDSGGFRLLMETNKLADEKGLKVGVGLYRRHHPAYLEQMKQVHDGKLGRISLLRNYCNMFNWGAQPRRADESELEYQLRNWRVFDWLGGGRLVEAHCHELDIMDWTMEAHPVDCNGMGGRTLASTEPRFGQDYDHEFNEYTYADGTKMYSQCRQLNGCWSPIVEYVHGEKGVMEFSGKIQEINTFGKREKISPYHKEHQDLLDAIWNGKPYNEGWFGATSSFTAVLGREACYSGQLLNWDELVAKGPDHFPKEEITWDTKPPVLPDSSGRYDHALAMPGVYRAYRA